MDEPIQNFMLKPKPKPWNMEATALFLIFVLGTIALLVTIQRYNDGSLPEPAMGFFRTLLR